MKKILLFCLIFATSLSFGQKETYVNLKTKYVWVNNAQIQIDTFSIQPFYFEIFDADNHLIDKDNYQVDFVNASLVFKHYETYKNTRVLLKYLVYPEFLRKTYRIIDKDKISRDSTKIALFENHEIKDQKPLNGLQTKGHISRGVNVGNNQSLVMQSGLNLQIEGKLSDKISLKAVLTDDNLPQAYSGISQSYKEFDRIYMQLSGKKWQATAGDLLLKSKGSYFLKYLRKTQGLDLKIGQDSAQVQIAGAMVEGQFAKNVFDGVEGNQGPYLLKGNQAETYIFVIAKTEKVFVNGKLLKRGANADYVINYETAELRFNATFPITQNQRIVVEFNYSVQHYLRYLNANKYTHKGKKLDFSVFTYLENDAKNKTLLFELSKAQQSAMQNAGDKRNELWLLSAVETDYDENKILYKKVVNSGVEYFEYTQENISNLYEVRFSYVGANQGTYKVKEIVAYGKIYEFVGEGNGSYEAKIRLTPAKSNQYAGVNFDYHPNDKTNIQFEALANYNDQNLFSPKDDDNNLGMASHLALHQQLWQKKDSKISLRLQQDFLHQNFKQLDAFRSPEFERNWQIDSIFGQQNMIDFGIDFTQKSSQIAIGFRNFSLRDTISTKQSYLQADWQLKNVNLLSDFRLTNQQNSQQNNKQSSYFHQEIEIENKKFSLQAIGHYEARNKQVFKRLDSLNYTYKFAEIAIQKKDSSRIGFAVGYRLSQNDSVRWGKNFRATKNHTVFSSFTWRKKMHKISVFAHYRHLDYYFTQRQRDFLNLKMLWQQYYYHKVLMTQVNVESFNGNTLRDELVFVETPPGQGTHQWVDYNHNGIKEINEFELAVYSDQANFIRVLLPSKNYIATLNNAYNLHLIINPRAFSKNKFLQRIYMTSQFKTQHQTEQNNKFTPFEWQPETSLYQNTFWQNDLYFNRSKKKYFVHFSYQKIQQAQLLSVGRQAHSIEKYSLQTKHSFVQNLIWKQTFSSADNITNSENYLSKNYQLRSQEIIENLDFVQVQKSKISIFYHLKNKNNILGNEKLTMYRLGAKYFYQDKKQNTFHTSLQLIKNKMSGSLNTPVAFQMLEGLQKGNNLVFMALYRQKISRYLEMNLQYNMRLSEANPAVHTGGISLKMLF